MQRDKGSGLGFLELIVLGGKGGEQDFNPAGTQVNRELEIVISALKEREIELFKLVAGTLTW